MKMKPGMMMPQLAMAGLLVLATGCDNAPKGDQATITEEQQVAEATGMTFTVDTNDSRIRFTGHGVGKNHPGKFRVTNGTVTVEGDQITGGSFEISMKSLDLEEEGEMFDQKLKPHLLSGDFFDAEKFSHSKFEITSVEPYQNNGNDTSIVEGANFNVSGNLTLRGETRNITFPARIELNDNELKGEANFDIDRTQWKMNYGNDKTLGDKFISETVNIELDLEANRM